MSDAAENLKHCPMWKKKIVTFWHVTVSGYRIGCQMIFRDIQIGFWREKSIERKQWMWLIALMATQVTRFPIEFNCFKFNLENLNFVELNYFLIDLNLNKTR